MTWKRKSCSIAGRIGVLLAVLGLMAGPAMAQSNAARQIFDQVSPGTLRDLLTAAESQPDVALTNILPASANKFRYVFIWPAENPVMTLDRINRSFRERFLQFAAAQRFLSTGYCLTPRGMGLTSEVYGSTRLYVAYRDIEVHRDLGWRETCRGVFVTRAEVESQIEAAEALARAGERARRIVTPPAKSDGVDPFLRGLQPPGGD